MLFVWINEKIERFCEEGGNNRGRGSFMAEDEEAEDEEREREPLNKF